MSKVPLSERWICTNCDWEGSQDDIRKEIVFPGSREEPDEWEWYCPECAASDKLEEAMDNAIWCRTCEDVIVKRDGAQCGECEAEYADYLRDKRKDDILTGDAD